MNLKDGDSRVVVITGASGVLGSSIAEVYAEQGWRVALAGRSVGRIQSVAQQMTDVRNRLHVVRGDLRDEKVLDVLMESTFDRFGRIDHVVHAAGDATASTLTSPDFDWHEHWHGVIDLHLTAVARLLRAWEPRAAAGSVLAVIGSAPVKRHEGRPDREAYSAAKAGLSGLGASYRSQQGRDPKFLVVHPAHITTDGSVERHVLPGDAARFIFRAVSATERLDLGEITLHGIRENFELNST